MVVEVERYQPQHRDIEAYMPPWVDARNIILSEYFVGHERSVVDNKNLPTVPVLGANMRIDVLRSFRSRIISDR
jgi:hypothetical protein